MIRSWLRVATRELRAIPFTLWVLFCLLEEWKDERKYQRKKHETSFNCN